MGLVKSEDVIAYRCDEQIYCPGCWEKNPADQKKLREQDLIIEKEIDDEDYLFCDVCGERIC